MLGLLHLKNKLTLFRVTFKSSLKFENKDSGKHLST